MFTILISLGFGVLTWLACWQMHVAKMRWCVIWALLATAIVQVVMGLILRKKIKADMDAVQQVLLNGQKKLQQKINQWQMRPPGSMKQAQMEIERDQRVYVEQALAASKRLEPYARWAMLMDKQIATMRMQLYYQIREFKKVDELLPKCVFMDPLTVAMKLSRLHMRGENDEADKFFKKQSKRLRYGQGAILYALYSWILVQRKDVEAAHKLLVNACTRMENETLKANRDHLANNRVNQFSNAGLGDEWYALAVEQPRIKAQRARHSDRPF
jgi:BMFP domain-containing protein YqiC